MREIVLIIKKEYRSFFSRSHMIKWLITVVAMTLLYPFIPFPDFVTSSIDQVYVIILLLAFVSGFMCINLGLDAVAAEKINKTLESLLTLPLNINKLLIGKVIFGMFITFSAYILMNIANYTILTYVLGLNVTTYFFSKDFILISIIVLHIHLIINLITCAMSLSVSNYKALGYALTGLDLLFVLVTAYLIYLEVNLIYNILFNFFILIILVLLIKKHLSKTLIIERL